MDWSTDVYCQNAHNQQHRQSYYLYQTERRGKKASCQRDRERVCVRDGDLPKMEVALVVKMAVGEMDQFGII
jgi:hypothetical protein